MYPRILVVASLFVCSMWPQSAPYSSWRDYAGSADSAQYSSLRQVTRENVARLMVVASMAFFLSYEWLHMAYHLPEESAIGRLRAIKRLRELHRRHHDPGGWRAGIFV